MNRMDEMVETPIRYWAPSIHLTLRHHATIQLSSHVQRKHLRITNRSQTRFGQSMDLIQIFLKVQLLPWEDTTKMCIWAVILGWPVALVGRCLAYSGARYLSTLAAAEQLYDALYQWNQIGSLDVTSTSLTFFQDLVPTITTGTYDSSSYTYASVVSAVQAYADGYLSIVEKYTPSDGSLAEQFSRDDGKPLSAVDLTWCMLGLFSLNVSVSF